MPGIYCFLPQNSMTLLCEVPCFCTELDEFDRCRLHPRSVVCCNGWRSSWLDKRPRLHVRGR